MPEILRKMILDVLPDIWPIIIIITVIVCTLRIAYLIKNKKRICLYKELFHLMFILYVMCLFEIVTIQDINYGTSNIIPFKEIFRYSFGSRLFIKNILGNIILFMPYGYFVSYYLKSHKALPICLLTIIVSTTIEIVQLKIGRTFDIDDIILNTCGGIIGYLLYSSITGIASKLPKPFQNDELINFIVVLIVIIVILYIINFNILTFIS